MRKISFAALAAVIASSSAFAHETGVAHAHPHGIDTVAAFLAAGGLLGLLWYLGLPPFEKRALRQIASRTETRR